MTRILILTRQAENYASGRLRTARPDLDVLAVDPFALELRLQDGRAGVRLDGQPLAAEDCVVVPRIGSISPEYSLNALEHLAAAGARCLNQPAGLLRLRHKYTMLTELARAGLPVPDTLMLRGGYGDIDDAVESLGGYPVVLKFVRGGQGVGVIKAQDGDTIRTVMEGLNLLQYDALLQRYLPGAASRDLRVFVLGGEARWGLQRTSSGGRFRSNFHQGGQAEAAQPDDEARALAVQAAAAFGLGVAGVDIAEDAGRRYILEVNGSPGFEATEAAHGADIAGAILDYAATQ